MKVTVISLSLIFSSFISYGQEQGNLVQYANDKTVADVHGNPMHPSTWYFPGTMFQDTMLWLVYPKFMKPKDNWTGEQKAFFSYGSHGINPGCIPTKETFSREMGIPLDSFTEVTVIKVDSFKLDWLSKELRDFNEPVLHNSYMGRAVYRFTWLRSFHNPVVITLQEKGRKGRLTTKILTYYKNNSVPDNETPIISVRKRTHTISPKTMRHFKKLLGTTAILTTQHKLRWACSVSTDGSNWVFEAHTKDGYYSTIRHSPKENEPINAVGKFLIKLSKPLKDDEVY